MLVMFYMSIHVIEKRVLHINHQKMIAKPHKAPSSSLGFCICWLRLFFFATRAFFFAFFFLHESADPTRAPTPTQRNALHSTSRLTWSH